MNTWKEFCEEISSHLNDFILKYIFCEDPRTVNTEPPTDIRDPEFDEYYIVPIKTN